MSTITFALRDGIATLTMDLAGRSMNLLTPEFLTDLDAAVDRVAGDDDIVDSSILIIACSC